MLTLTSIRRITCSICGFSSFVNTEDPVPTKCPACHDGAVFGWEGKFPESVLYVK